MIDDTLKKARAFAARHFRENRGTCHPSHDVADALLAAEKKFDLGTFGVEGTCQGNGDPVDLQYLNTGDTYATTLLHFEGRFRVGCWGDIMEQHSTQDQP